MFYSYKNCKIVINGVPYYVQSASLSERGSIEPSYINDSKYNNNYVASDGIGGSLKISYLLTGRDQLVDYISLDESPIKVNFGGMYFHNGYLRNYGFSLEPNKPLIVNSEIIFFDSLSGTFAPTYENAQNYECLNSADVRILNLPGSVGTSTISNITRFNYQYDVDIQPQYIVGEVIPSRIVFGKRNVSAEISNDRVLPFLSVSGLNSTLRVTLNHPTINTISQNIDVKGLLYQKTFSVDSNNLLNNTISIQQNNLENFNLSDQQNIPKTRVFLFFPSSGYYGTLVKVSGINLNYVDYISMRDNVFANFSHINNTEIQFSVPNGALSGPISFFTSGGYIQTDDSFFIGGLPISILSISPITGQYNDTINISGENFYEISDVIFHNNQPSEFSVLNSSNIQAKVPRNAQYGTVKVVSDIFSLSGESQQQFVPIPNILGFNPLSGFSGDYITISGFGFYGLTGVKLNNLPTGYSGDFSIIDNTGIYLKIPSGNTNGFIRLYGQSGVTSLSSQSFYPYALITGIVPYSGRTGTMLEISGRNFIPEILYNLGSNKYIVGFNGGVTGYFTFKNAQTLSGAVPYGARSGNIYIYSQNQNEYPSSFVFNVKNESPSITYIQPNSGKTGDLISILGDNIVNINRMIITGLNTGYVFSSNDINHSVTNNYVNFNIPNVLTGGRYDVILDSLEGYATGSGLYILQAPYISGFSPISGSAGSVIRITGRDLYPYLSEVWIDNSGTKVNVDTGSLTYNNNILDITLSNNISSGKHSIVVYNTAGTGVAGGLLTFVPSQIISGFYPLSGEWGDTINLTGNYLSSTIRISISNISGAVSSFIGDTGITFSIPIGAQTDYISIYNNFGSIKSADKIVVVPPLPVVSGFSPAEGYYGTGIVVSGLYLNTVREVHFSGLTGGYVSNSNLTTGNSTGLYFNIPGGVTSNRLRFVNDRGQVYSNQILNIISGANISLLSTYTGVFGDQIRMSGKYLSGSKIYFTAPDDTLVLADNISIIGDSGAYFNVPKEIKSSNLIIEGRNKVTVTDTGKFVVLPTISGISGGSSFPSGSYITLTGINASEASGFLGISGVNNFVYNIANINQFSGTYNTGHTIINTFINSNYAGSGRLFLASYLDRTIGSSITGSLTYANKNKIVFPNVTTISQPAPILTYISRTGGNDNTSITISGGYLFSTNNIIINVGSSFGLATQTSTGDREIIFTLPANFVSGSGTIYLTTPFGTVQTGRFLYLQRLYLSGISPEQGQTGQQIILSGSGLLGVTGVLIGPFNANFSGGYLQNTYRITGMVPIANYSCCGETVNVCLLNQAETICV